jgi:hypothetical protein
VVVDVKNTIIMSDMPIILMLEEDESVAEGMLMPPMSIVVENTAVAVLLVLPFVVEESQPLLKMRNKRCCKRRCSTQKVAQRAAYASKGLMYISH